MEVLRRVRPRRLGLSASISFGNNVTTMHMEFMKNGRRSVEALRKVTKAKSVVMLKAGRVNYRVRAAELHTSAVIGATTW